MGKGQGSEKEMTNWLGGHVSSGDVTLTNQL
jgi:hypothetical protein